MIWPLSTVPMLCTLVIILAVGSYITYQHLHPPLYNITLPPPVLPPASPPRHPDITIEDIEEETRNNDNERGGGHVFSVSAQIDAGNMERTQDPGYRNESIQRRDDNNNNNPFMFYRVRPPFKCLPPAALDTLLNIKRCLKLNLLSLITIGFVMPENIVFIYIFATDIGDICDCEEGGVKTAVDFIIYPLTYLFGFIHPFLIKKKLDNFKYSYKFTAKVNAEKIGDGCFYFMSSL